MQIHESVLTVKKEHLDLIDHVNNVQYVQWVQDMAEAHWNKKSTDAMRNDYYWVMISHYIQYKGEAKLGDTLLLKTYVKESAGVKSTRMVEIYNKSTDKLLTVSETIWCFMSKTTNRPMRIPEEIATLFS